MDEALTPMLVRSFVQNRGKRGAHFYDSNRCEFLPWADAMKAAKKLPESFSEKLIDTMANYDPDTQFITVKAGDGQIVIELFKGE